MDVHEVEFSQPRREPKYAPFRVKGQIDDKVLGQGIQSKGVPAQELHLRTVETKQPLGSAYPRESQMILRYVGNVKVLAQIGLQLVNRRILKAWLTKDWRDARRSQRKGEHKR